jgi:hypothetical protein
MAHDMDKGLSNVNLDARDPRLNSPAFPATLVRFPHHRH